MNTTVYRTSYSLHAKSYLVHIDNTIFFNNNQFLNQNQFFNLNQFSIMKTKTNTTAWFMSLALVLLCAFGAAAQQANFDPNNAVVLTPEGAKPYAKVSKDGSVNGQKVSQPDVLTPELSASRLKAGFPELLSAETKKQIAQQGSQDFQPAIDAFIVQFKDWANRTENWESYMSREEMNIINQSGLASLWKYNFYKAAGSNSNAH